MAEASAVVSKPVSKFVDMATSLYSSSTTLASLVDDEIYKHLRKCFIPGRGRPPALPEVGLTNCILLQLKMLQVQAEGKKTFKDVSTWFDALFPEVSYPSSRLSGALDRLEKKAQNLLTDGGDIHSFLNTQVDFDFVSVSLTKIGLKRRQLLREIEWTQPDHLETLTHETVVDIEQFRVKEKQPETFTCSWIKALSLKHSASPDLLLKKSVKKIMETYKSMIKNVKHQSEALGLFLSMHFDTMNKALSLSTPTPEQKEMKQLRTANSVCQENIKDMKEDLAVIKTALNEVSAVKMRLVSDLEEKTKETTELRASVATLQATVLEKDKRLGQVNPLRVNKLQERLHEARTDLRAAQKENTHMDLVERVLEKERRTLQKTRVQVSKLKATVRKLESKNVEMRQQVQDLLDNDKLNTADEDIKAGLRAGDKNRYSDCVRKTIMALQGDANVSASQCSKVISIVAQHLFKTNIGVEDLPCLQTAVNIADEGQVITKFQATEKILEADNITLHTDGTSRNGNKIVGQQVTLDNGVTLNLGLTTVCTEDSETLLEVTVQMLQELADVYAADETDDQKEAVFNALLTKMTSCMSDRAAVMKLFGTKLCDFLTSRLGQDVTMHFLKCNAHFLLGLSRSCESSLKTLEDELKDRLKRKLGRDTLNKFQRFHGNESATARVIRLASSLLGPRGDEKNGRRAEWLAFLEKKSFLTSYRSNRFNCFFVSAAAVVHHLQDMNILFHSGLLGRTNLKIESLAEDIKDFNLLALVCAIALLYFSVTGPFWNLLQSEVKYYELFVYIQKLESCIGRWREDASELLDADFAGIFDGEVESEMKTAVYQFASEHAGEVKHALEVIMRDLLIVTRLQLADFLLGGQYGEDQPPDVKEQLQHCPITNLLGENVFGEMDFIINKSHSASFHHHTSTLMLKHNKTSKWLQEKNSEDAKKIMTLARRKSKSLRMEHKRQELLVKLHIREKLLQNERERKQKEAKVAAQRANIIERVRDHGGPCHFASDVAQLIRKMRDEGASRTRILHALQDEIRFQKHVLGVGKALKIVKKSVNDLSETLQAHLGQCPNEAGQLSADERSADEQSSDEEQMGPSPSKRHRTGEPNRSCIFTRQGEWVAVFYDQNFYIGQVTEIKSKTEAQVSFLEKTKGRTDYFRWPRLEDIASVDNKYVFRWSVEVLPVSNNGRIWQVSDLEDIAEAYNRLLC